MNLQNFRPTRSGLSYYHNCQQRLSHVEYFRILDKIFWKVHFVFVHIRNGSRTLFIFLKKSGRDCIFVVLSENHNLHPISDWCRRHKVLKITAAAKSRHACTSCAYYMHIRTASVWHFKSPPGSLLPNSIITRIGWLQIILLNATETTDSPR